MSVHDPDEEAAFVTEHEYGREGKALVWLRINGNRYVGDADDTPSSVEDGGTSLCEQRRDSLAG